MKKEEVIRVLLIEKKDGLKTIIQESLLKNTLETFQEKVGGYIEVIPALPMNTSETLHLVIHEEGKFVSNHPATIGFLKNGKLIDYVAGNGIMVRSNENGEFCSLQDLDVERILEAYSQNGTIVLNESVHHVLLLNL